MRSLMVVLGMVFVVSAAGVSAQGAVSADEKAVRGVIDQMISAWNKGDAKAYVQNVAPDYEEVATDGTHLKGRAAIENMTTTEFAARKGATPKLTVTTVTVRFLKPDVALTMGTWSITGLAPVAVKGSWNATYLKQGSTWLAANALIATDMPPDTPPPSPAKK